MDAIVEFIRSPISSAISFLLGLLLGNWLALGRDKRKEFNEIAQPIRADLLKELKTPRQDGSVIDAVDEDALYWRIPMWRRRGFRSAVQRYKQSKRDNLAQDNRGCMYWKDTKPITDSVTVLLRYTVPR